MAIISFVKVEYVSVLECIRLNSIIFKYSCPLMFVNVNLSDSVSQSLVVVGYIRISVSL